MHPLNVDCFRLIISSRSMIRYLQRRVSWWLAIWSLNLLFRSQFSCTLNADCFKILISARFFNAEWVSATVENARLFMTGDLVTHSVVSISIIMHPQRWLLRTLISSRSMIRYLLRYLQRRVIWETVENRDVVVVSSSPNVRSGRHCCLKFTQCSLWCVEFDTDSIFCECCFILFKTCRFFTTIIQLDWLIDDDDDDDDDDE